MYGHGTREPLDFVINSASRRQDLRSFLRPFSNTLRVFGMHTLGPGGFPPHVDWVDDGKFLLNRRVVRRRAIAKTGSPILRLISNSYSFSFPIMSSIAISSKRTPSAETNAMVLTYPPRSVPVDSRTAQITRVQTPIPTPTNDLATAESQEFDSQQLAFELAPVDRGKDAW